MKRSLALGLVALVFGFGGREAQSNQGLYDIQFASHTAVIATADNDASPLVPAQDAQPLVAGDCDACDPAGCGWPKSCCGPKCFAFGELLVIRPTNEKVAYALPINGAIVPPAGVAPVQVGLEATVDCDYDAGFRVGVGMICDDCSTLSAAYTFYETDTDHAIAETAPYVVRSLVDHPGSWAAPTDFFEAAAWMDIDLDLVDLDYRRPLVCDACSRIDYLVGVRYAHLDQTFASTFTGTTTIETVDAAVRFDGGGIRVGLEGERQLPCFGLMVYGRGVASFVGGDFRGRYQQADNARGLVVDTGWNEDRIVSILDLEVGFGWTGCGGMLQASAGYMFSGWYDVVVMDEFIDSVRMNNSVGTGDCLGFDGLVARAELCF